MPQKIYQKGERILRQKAAEVPLKEIKRSKIRAIIKKMEKAIAEKEEALAIAAPQIGEPWRIFVVSEWALHPEEKAGKAEFKNIIFINPEITKISKDKKPRPESCLSAPAEFGLVQRANKIKVEAYNEKGKKFSRGASDLLAQTIQHEMDHLDGILFVDKQLKTPKEKPR